MCATNVATETQNKTLNMSEDCLRLVEEHWTVTSRWPGNRSGNRSRQR